MTFETPINSFQERANNLRQDLIDAIVCILKDNNLTSIQLTKHPDETPWVVWFDNKGYGFDSRVRKVSLADKGFSIETYDEDCCSAVTHNSEDYVLACTNIDWLCDILSSINYTLNLPTSAGTLTIAEQLIQWSYDEPGLSELPLEEIPQIETELSKCILKGKLNYYDANNVEYNGTWNIK